MRPLRLAIIGMGGFAGAHHEAVLRLEEKKSVRLIATCDPRAASFSGQRETWRFAARGIRVFERYEALLESCAHELDGVLIPTPLHLHAEMHRAVVSRQIPAFLEKPPTLDPREFDAMLAVESEAKVPTAVGFNLINDPTRRRLKERLLAGDFGPLLEAHLKVFWPRPLPYFQRTPWSGRLIFENHLVLDSCLGSAMAHAAHALLFWAGAPALDSWARPMSIQAEHFRVNPIAAADSSFVSVATEEGPRLRLVLSHACHGASCHSEVLRCQNATVRFTVGKGYEISRPDEPPQRYPADPTDPLEENILDFLRLVRGEKSRPATTLADARSLLTVHGLSYLSAGQVTALPPTLTNRVRDTREQLDYLTFAGLESLAEDFLNQGQWPGLRLGLRSSPPALATPNDLPRLPACIQALVT